MIVDIWVVKMRSLIVVLCLLTCVLCDSDSSSISSTNVGITNNTDNNFHKQIMAVLEMCLNAGANYSITAPRYICTNLKEKHECLVQQEIRWNRTHSGQLNKVFVSFRHLTHAFMDTLCANESEKLNALIQGWEEMSSDRFQTDNDANFIMGCMYASSIMLENVLKGPIGTPSMLWFYYLNFHFVRWCTISNLEENRPHFSKLIVEVINSILENMKCLDPIIQEMILCDELDPQLIEKEKLCPMKSLQDNVKEKILDNHFNMCFVNEMKPIILNTNPELSVYQDFFRGYCQHSERFKDCTKETNILSRTCLDSSDLNIMNLALSNMQVFYDTICVQQGEHLAIIFHALANASSKSQSQPGELMQCLGTAFAPVQSILNMHGVHEKLPDVKACFLGIESVDEAYKNALNEIYNLLQVSMQCTDHENMEVTCNTLDTE